MAYTYEDAREFSEHPIKAYDPFYTRDITMFDYHFSMFREFLIRELKAIIRDIDEGTIDPNCFDTRKEIANLKSLWYTVHKKCQAYASHTGINLISKNNYNL